MTESPGDQKTSLLALAALGIMYGDIGTSPLYALRECFSPVIGLTTTPPDLGHSVPADLGSPGSCLNQIPWSGDASR